MFKLTTNPTFWATADISIPGEAEPVPLEVEFRWLGRAGIREFFSALEGKSDEDALAEIVVNWRNVEEAFSRENLARLLDAYPSAAMAIFNAFSSESLKAKTKN